VEVCPGAEGGSLDRVEPDRHPLRVLRHLRPAHEHPRAGHVLQRACRLFCVFVLIMDAHLIICLLFHIYIFSTRIREFGHYATLFREQLLGLG
jgi:hypothetical protein